MTLSSVHNLSDAIGVPYDWLAWRAAHPKLYYRYFNIRKRSGGWRGIAAPDKYLSRAQRWVADNLCRPLDVHKNATAYSLGSSIKQNAKLHEGAEVVVRIDIQDFFWSIKRAQIVDFFEQFVVNPDVVTFLTDLCTLRDCLPQGAPSSPILSNLICKSLDESNFYNARGFRAQYSRYADDIFFSLNSYTDARELFDLTAKVILDQGFRLNTSKSRIISKGQRKSITGLVVGSSGVGIGRTKEREIKAAIHNLLPGSADYQSDLMKIKGYLAWVSDVDPIRYERLVKKLPD